MCVCERERTRYRKIRGESIKQRKRKKMRKISKASEMSQTEPKL